MAELRVRVWDITSSRCQEVQAPDDVSIARLLALVVEKMRLPLNSPDGQIMSYKFHHKQSGRQLLDNKTLSELGVRDGDDLRLQPEITAGCFAVRCAAFGFPITSIRAAGSGPFTTGSNHGG